MFNFISKNTNIPTTLLQTDDYDQIPDNMVVMLNNLYGDISKLKWLPVRSLFEKPF